MAGFTFRESGAQGCALRIRNLAFSDVEVHLSSEQAAQSRVLGVWRSDFALGNTDSRYLGLNDALVIQVSVSCGSVSGSNDY